MISIFDQECQIFARTENINQTLGVTKTTTKINFYV
jgi:hypothetical protein